MSPFEQAYLCGIIKKGRPRKAVEIGVAAGGTTAVLLNTLNMLGLNTTVYSVDLAEAYYRNKNRKTGFLAEEYKKIMKDTETSFSITHELLTGKTIAEQIKKIGGGIDCLILDTMHILPGEILDFLVCLPYLSKNAYVIMHDIRNNHFRAGNIEGQQYATQILYDVADAKKIFVWDGKEGKYPNIGTFQITSETYSNIESMFHALSITWAYMPDDKMLQDYRKCFAESYNETCIQIFDCIVEMQKSTKAIKEVAKHYSASKGTLAELKRKCQNAGTVYLYGNGHFAEQYRKWAEINGIAFKAIVVSDDQIIEVKEKESLPVLHLSEIKDTKSCAFVIGVSELYKKEVVNNLLEQGVFCIL